MNLRYSRGRLSADAREDLFAIHDYFAETNPDYWPTLRNRLEEGINKVTARPSLGRRKDPLIPARYRVFLVRPYYIIFEEDKHGVAITRVLHSARNFCVLFDRD